MSRKQAVLDAARALRRLLALQVVTELGMLALRARAWRHGDDPAIALGYGQRWARLALSGLGVELERSGEVPHGRVLVVANHRSYVDIPVLLSALPCAFLAKHEVASWPLFGRAAGLQRTVFVHRECKASRRAAREAAGALLERGLSFAAFPEGTTTRGPGIIDFYPGLFELAAERGIPVLPVAIAYGDPDDAFVDDDAFLPHFLRRFGRSRVRVHVAFGPLLQARDGIDLRSAAQAWIGSRLAWLDTPAAAPVPQPGVEPPALPALAPDRAVA